VLTQGPRPKTELTSESERNAISVVSGRSTACIKGSMSAGVCELLASCVRLRRCSAFSENNKKTAVDHRIRRPLLASRPLRSALQLIRFSPVRRVRGIVGEATLSPSHKVTIFRWPVSCEKSVHQARVWRESHGSYEGLYHVSADSGELL
jgi:hypothetical protein